MQKKQKQKEQEELFEEFEITKFKEKIIEKLRKVGRPTFNNIVLAKARDRGNPVTPINDKLLLTALARIILPLKDDKCACIKVENGKIFWSSNSNLTTLQQEEVNQTVKDLAWLVIEENNTEKQKLKRKLLRRAVLKDANYWGPKVRRAYEDSLKGDFECWDSFTNSLVSFKSSGSTEELEEEQLLGGILEKRQELVKVLVEIRKENEGQLPYRLFKVLFNVTDLLIILQQINDHERWWWGKIFPILEKEAARSGTSFQAVKTGIEMHAEMKMLEEKSKEGVSGKKKTTEKRNMEIFIGEIADPECQFAITKRLCLLCDLTFSACEEALSGFRLLKRKESSRKKVNEVNRGSKVYFDRWKAFSLSDSNLRSKIRSSFEKLFQSILKEISKEVVKEDIWVEEQVVYANLERETSVKTLFFT